MPLQNRVTPLGDLIATPERGTFYGNRGVLHNPQREIVRHSQVKRWIICALEFRGRHRPDVMPPGRYTGLFFLDEATALAAGHRPCAECRHAEYQHYRRCWAEGQGLATLPSADEMDAVLHAERLEAPEVRRIWQTPARDLPPGTFALFDAEPWLHWDNAWQHWTPAGYDQRRPFEPSETVDVITPPSTVAAIKAGYAPVVHQSAQAS